MWALCTWYHSFIKTFSLGWGAVPLQNPRGNATPPTRSLPNRYIKAPLHFTSQFKLVSKFSYLSGLAVPSSPANARPRLRQRIYRDGCRSRRLRGFLPRICRVREVRAVTWSGRDRLRAEWPRRRAGGSRLELDRWQNPQDLHGLLEWSHSCNSALRSIAGENRQTLSMRDL